MVAFFLPGIGVIGSTLFISGKSGDGVRLSLSRIKRAEDRDRVLPAALMADSVPALDADDPVLGRRNGTLNRPEMDSVSPAAGAIGARDVVEVVEPVRTRAGFAEIDSVAAAAAREVVYVVRTRAGFSESEAFLA